MTDQMDAPKTRKPPVRTNPTVEFVEEIPGIVRGARGFHPRASKYDAIYAALRENPGRWAKIGEGDSLYGALVGYRKRRELEDLTIAFRGDMVYAGVDIPRADNEAGDQGTTDAESSDADDEGDEDEDGADGADEQYEEVPQNAANTAVPGDDTWA